MKFAADNSGAWRNEGGTSETDARANRAETVDEADRVVLGDLCGRLVGRRAWSPHSLQCDQGVVGKAIKMNVTESMRELEGEREQRHQRYRQIFATGTTALQQTFP